MTLSVPSLRLQSHESPLWLCWPPLCWRTRDMWGTGGPQRSPLRLTSMAQFPRLPQGAKVWAGLLPG